MVGFKTFHLAGSQVVYQWANKYFIDLFMHLDCQICKNTYFIIFFPINSI